MVHDTYTLMTQLHCLLVLTCMLTVGYVNTTLEVMLHDVL